MAQCFVGHYRAEVGTADADVDDVTNPLTSVALPLTAAYAVGEVGHPIEHGMDMRNDILAIDDNRCPPWRTQGNVQYSPVLADIDFVAPEHRVDARAQTALLGQFNEQPHGFIGDAVFRVVEIHTGCLHRQPLATLRIVSEQVAQMPIAHLLEMRREGFPCRLSGERFRY